MAPSYRTVQDILRKSGKGRSTIHGNSYHLRLAIMIILRAYQMHQLDNELDFTIAVEVAASGKFDDILYHCTSPRLPTGTLFIQAKHKLKDGNVSKPSGGSTITEKALLDAWNPKSAYSIPMYFMSFLEVDQNLPSGSRYVLCTNAGLEKNIESHFTIINPEQDNALLFCEDIGATCYQLSRDKPFPRLADILRDTCIAKLGKLFAEAVFAGTVVTLNDILVDTLYSFIHTCLVRLKPKPNDSSVSTFGFKKEFFNESDSTTTGKFQTAIRKEYETLAKDKQKYDSNSLYKLEVKIEIKRSFTATPNKRQANIFAEFDQKVHEFYAKFLLVCNSSNEEALREKAMTLLPRWCNVERGTAFDKLQSVLLDALKSDKPVPMGLKFVQQCFVDIEFKQNIGRLMSFSEEYLSSLRLKHSQVEVHPQYLKRSSVHAFLQNKSAFGVYQFDSLLDMTLSSYILMQMLSLSNCDTLFVDSAKYQTGEYMATILQNLLSYLKAVNHPTIKVITVLGKHDQVSINEMKKLSKKYCQKIIVVEKVSGDTPPNGGPMEWYFGNNVKHEAWSQMFKVNDLLLFGTVSPLSGIVDEADNLSFLLALLALGKQSNEREEHNLNTFDYEKIKNCYIHRSVVPYQEDKVMNHSRFYKYANRSKVGLRSTVKNEQNSQENEPVPPGIQNGAEQKVHIFFNDTGHGKTYYLTWLAWRLAALDRSLYVIKLIGKDCSTYFKRLEESNIQNLNDTEIVRLLFSYIHLASSAPNGNRDEYVPCAKLLTVANGKIVLNKAKEKELPTEELIKLRVFREKFNLQKLVLILDGFDEIVPCCKDAVMYCFARFVQLKGVRSLYLSGRSYGFESDLKNTFNHCQLYELVPFSREDVKISWHKFLQKNLNDYEQSLRTWDISTSVHRLTITLANKLDDVVTVPLFLRMVQTILLPQIKEHFNVNKHAKYYQCMCGSPELDTFNLVQSIVDKMIDGIDNTYSSIQIDGNSKCVRTQRKEIEERAMLLAMYVIFAEKDRAKLLSKEEKQSVEDLMQQLSHGKAKTEFVVGVVNGEPIFVHFILAEFFAAHWFYKNRNRFRTESIFQSQVFWSRPLHQIRYFFNCLFVKESEGCELHWAVLNRSDDRIDKILQDNPTAIAVKDKAGRLPIHLTTNYTDSLNVTQNNAVYERDELFGWNALDYAFVENMFWGADEFLILGVEATILTLTHQLCSNETEVVLEQAIEYFSCLAKYEHQTGTANQLCQRVARYLINERTADIYVPGETMLWYSMLEYCIKKRNVLMFHYLINCDSSNEPSHGLNQSLVQKEKPPVLLRVAYGLFRSGSLPNWSPFDEMRSQILNGYIDRFFAFSFRDKAYNITNYLLEHHPPCMTKLKDMSISALVGCAKSAIETNSLAIFRKVFHQLCTALEIPHVEEKDIVDDGDVPDINDIPFRVDIPFATQCCAWHGTFFRELEAYKEDNEFYKEAFLAQALNVGSARFISYILQKTKTNVTNTLIIVLMHLLSLFRRYSVDHKKSTPAFNYLLNKSLDLHIVDQTRRNLLQTTVEDGCLCMVPCLVNKGFDPQQIYKWNHSKLFERSSQERLTNLFMYLQKHTCVDVFLPYTFGVSSWYIIDTAIGHGYSTFTKTLFEAKYWDYRFVEIENALIAILQQQLQINGTEYLLYLLDVWKPNQETDGNVLNHVMWDLAYCSILKKIPIV